jgi:hypothetical protein
MVSALPATVTVTGAAATFVHTTPGNYTLSVDPGSFTLSGAATRLSSPLDKWTDHDPDSILFTDHPVLVGVGFVDHVVGDVVSFTDHSPDS